VNHHKRLVLDKVEIKVNGYGTPQLLCKTTVSLRSAPCKKCLMSGWWCVQWKLTDECVTCFQYQLQGIWSLCCFWRARIQDWEIVCGCCDIDEKGTLIWILFCMWFSYGDFLLKTQLYILSGKDLAFRSCNSPCWIVLFKPWLWDSGYVIIRHMLWRAYYVFGTVLGDESPW
jgi:hypothetical protein